MVVRHDGTLRLGLWQAQHEEETLIVRPAWRVCSRASSYATLPNENPLDMKTMIATMILSQQQRQVAVLCGAATRALLSKLWKHLVFLATRQR
jgi:hypothetical protein